MGRQELGLRPGLPREHRVGTCSSRTPTCATTRRSSARPSPGRIRTGGPRHARTPRGGPVVLGAGDPPVLRPARDGLLPYAAGEFRHLARGDGERPVSPRPRDAYESVGGHAAIRGYVLEDVAFARRLRAAGKRLRFAWAPELLETPDLPGRPRDVRGAEEERPRHPVLAVRQFGFLAGILAIFLLPLLTLPLGSGRAPSFSPRSAPSSTSPGSPSTRCSRARSAWTACTGLLFPVAVGFYLVLIGASIVDGLRGKPGLWKGRSYSMDGEGSDPAARLAPEHRRSGERHAGAAGPQDPNPVEKVPGEFPICVLLGNLRGGVVVRIPRPGQYSERTAHASTPPTGPWPGTRRRGAIFSIFSRVVCQRSRSADTRFGCVPSETRSPANRTSVSVTNTTESLSLWPPPSTIETPRCPSNSWRSAKISSGAGPGPVAGLPEFPAAGELGGDLPPPQRVRLGVVTVLERGRPVPPVGVLDGGDPDGPELVDPAPRRLSPEDRARTERRVAERVARVPVAVDED